MRKTHVLVAYLMMFCITIANFPHVRCGEYQEEYPAYEEKQYEFHHHHHEYHPPAKKAAHLDVNIPLDFGTIAKLGVLGLTQLKLLFALGKVAGAGLGVGALALGQIGKVALSVSSGHHGHHHGHHGGGIAIDVGPVAKTHTHYEHAEKHY